VLSASSGSTLLVWFVDDALNDHFLNGVRLFVDLKDTASQLAYFAHLDHEVTIVFLSDLGVTFYAVSVDLKMGGREKVPDFGTGDGYIFVPASNIKSISNFGHTCRG